MSGRIYRSLSDVLKYDNRRVTQKFTELYDISIDDAMSIFTEVKKWLWLCHTSTAPLLITEPIVIIDEMWHNFILFTLDYAEFCQEYFGRFMHHAPVTDRPRRSGNVPSERLSEGFVAARIAQLSEQYMYIYHHLGEDTLLTWYVEYPQRYGTEFFTHKRKIRPIVWQPTAVLREMYRARLARNAARAESA